MHDIQRENSHFPWLLRIGNVSTRKAPGTVTSSISAKALAAEDKKGSSCDFMSSPYASDMTTAPVALKAQINRWPVGPFR